jgi:hypothetical protein
MTDNTRTSTAAGEIPPAVIEFAGKMYNAARTGDMDVFQQALPAGLPANMRNEKGDTLVDYSCLSLRMRSHYKLWLLYHTVLYLHFALCSMKLAPHLTLSEDLN